MARAQTGDLLQGFRYHVKSLDNEYNPLKNSADRDAQTFNSGEGGFQSATLPEISVDSVDYREGNSTYTAKYPGIPTVSDVTLMRGVVRDSNAFWDWIISAIRGRKYRVDLGIYHFTRDQIEPEAAVDLKDVRSYFCFECFPIRVKPAGDMDGTASEVSLEEVDIALEKFSINDDTFK